MAHHCPDFASTFYEPWVGHPPTKPQVPTRPDPAPTILQCPRTASSGRRLIVVSCGGSYLFLPSLWLSSRFIRLPRFLRHAACNRPCVSKVDPQSAAPTTPTTSHSHACIIQNR